MTARTRSCNETIAAGRMRKAEQFLTAADTIRDFADDEIHRAISLHVPLCRLAGLARGPMSRRRDLWRVVRVSVRQA